MDEHMGGDPTDHAKNTHDAIEIFSKFSLFLSEFGTRLVEEDGTEVNRIDLTEEKLRKAQEIFVSEGQRSPSSVSVAIVDSLADIDGAENVVPATSTLIATLRVASQEVDYFVLTEDGSPDVEFSKDISLVDRDAYETVEDVDFIATAATAAQSFDTNLTFLLDEKRVNTKEIRALLALSEYLVSVA
jgi:acetylornithine deacetylase/succinyl-diaminopimelate desuccinylase-like protein